MGNVKRLELWWQPYLYVTSGSGLRKKPPTDFSACECTSTSETCSRHLKVVRMGTASSSKRLYVSTKSHNCYVPEKCRLNHKWHEELRCHIKQGIFIFLRYDQIIQSTGWMLHFVQYIHHLSLGHCQLSWHSSWLFLVCSNLFGIMGHKIVIHVIYAIYNDSHIQWSKVQWQSKHNYFIG
jgi:hypothetical protein